MKTLKKNLIPIIILILLLIIFIGSTKNSIYTSAQNVPGRTIRVVVLLSSFNDDYISIVQQNLEKIQDENKGTIDFIFFDGKGDQDIQNETMSSIFETDFDLLLANLVDISSTNVDSLINRVKQKNIPVILFNIAPLSTESIKSYPKALVIATNAAQSGILQGKILVNDWNNNKASIDKNKDNILQYVMIKNKNNNTLTNARTQYSISALDEAGIKTREVAIVNSTGSKDSTKNDFEQIFLRYSNQIESIIANDDTMAIGAIEVLQKYGYNLGDPLKTIPVVGANAIPEAKDLIKRGIMLGTVVQDAPAMAEALYKIGVNLVNNNNPLANTNYTFNDTGVVIEMPYYEYSSK
ncbi:substrate-binding domain-containing protein [Clostridium chromiireducens]|uniref:D-galactose/methyl-galactoside binding periplasmic protein MglB n=1 Tax=Clostridium chromiireducens TaxID=225345 RepID=A0A964W2C3_9CLOT|nr:galactose ABC transporter substrate-binding protein [Clostridium chromiireducens]MVX64075.1 substrate-binding domain-containing protein [Clostridium chromiireducens]